MKNLTEEPDTKAAASDDNQRPKGDGYLERLVGQFVRKKPDWPDSRHQEMTEADVLREISKEFTSPERIVAMMKTAEVATSKRGALNWLFCAGWGYRFILPNA